MTPEEAESAVGLAITMSLLGVLVGIAFYVWYSLALSALFTKLGVDSWRGWVPVLNEMEILARGGVPGWSVVYYFIPVVNLYGLYLKATAVHRIGLELGRGTGMTVLGILLPPVWASILGWGPTRAVAGVYDKRVESMLGSGDTPAPSAASGPLGDGAPPAARPAPFSQVASDPSGYALPVARPVAPPPAPAFAPPPESDDHAVAVSPAPVAPSSPDDAADAAPAASTPAPGLIHNPWAPRPLGVETPARPLDVPAAQTAGPEAEAEPAIAVASPRLPSVASVLGGDDEDELDRTVVVDRRPVVPWKLRTDDGFEVALTASKIVLGRNPSSAELDVEAVAIPDTTRTLSKTHARLDLVDGAWTVTDLHSTNGVLVTGADGTEELIAVDEAVPLHSRFVLGKVGMALSFEAS